MSPLGPTSRSCAIWVSGPPILRALAAQGLLFLLLLLVTRSVPRFLPFWGWIALQGLLAAALAAWWGLGRWWWVFQVLLPLALVWQLGHPVPFWIYPTLLAGMLLVYGGGILTRVPLYNSGREAWEDLLALVPEQQPFQMADLGAGLGGPLAFLAPQRPEARFTGVEASPLVWLIGWLRCLPFRRNCRIVAGSLWQFHLHNIDLAFAFLSPAPMTALWQKALKEMRPGTLLVSHSFAIPGVAFERRIPLRGLPGACLLLYRIPQLSPESEPELQKLA